VDEDLVFALVLIAGALVLIGVLAALVIVVVIRFYRRLDEAGDPMSNDPEDFR
jgi:hypothetical protein